ncbi:hypothetical protein J6590_039269 [Homalodisca vitripennis]|nr:hypothetical protein J6590_039269 [Homalodisca vitripennis]
MMTVHIFLPPPLPSINYPRTGQKDSGRPSVVESEVEMEQSRGGRPITGPVRKPGRRDCPIQNIAANTERWLTLIYHLFVYLWSFTAASS